MMKIRKIHIVLTSLLMILGATSCKERLPKHFDEISGVYFNNRTSANALVDSTSVTFIYEDNDRIDIPVAIKLMGRLSDQPRKVLLRVWSEDAEVGKDYILPEEIYIPAGQADAQYMVTLIKTPDLKAKAKTVWLELLPGGELGLPVKGEKNAAGEFVSALKFRIVFSDMFTTPPAAWEKDLLGEFTQQKFELITKVLDDIDRSAFNDPEKMTLSLSLFISVEMTRYVSEQVEKKAKGQDYDKDAFDKKTGEALSFSK